MASDVTGQQYICEDTWHRNSSCSITSRDWETRWQFNLRMHSSGCPSSCKASQGQAHPKFVHSAGQCELKQVQDRHCRYCFFSSVGFSAEGMLKMCVKSFAINHNFCSNWLFATGEGIILGCWSHTWRCGCMHWHCRHISSHFGYTNIFKVSRRMHGGHQAGRWNRHRCGKSDWNARLRQYVPKFW